MDVPTALDRLNTAITKRRCLPFIGAGVSAWHNCEWPDDKRFKQLVDRLTAYSGDDCRKIVNDVVTAALNEKLLPCDVTGSGSEGAPPTWFLRACMLARFDDERRRMFLDKPLNMLAEELHELAPGMLAELLEWAFCEKQPNVLHWILALFSFQTIVTTNFDDCLECASRLVGRILNVRGNDEQLLENGLVHPLILKAHGSLDAVPLGDHSNENAARRYLKQIVLTERQYDVFRAGRPLLRDYLRVLMATHSLLFLGYSLSDHNILDVLCDLEAFKDHSSTVIAVFRSADPNQIAHWGRRNVHIVSCDHAEFLKQLWARFSGVRVDSIEDIPSSARTGSPDPGIAVAILMRYASRSVQFRESLRWATKERIFPGEKLTIPTDENGNCVWPSDGIEKFLNMKWLRRMNFTRGSDDQFYEFPVDLRLALKECLKADSNS